MFINPRLELLITLRFISKQGIVNKETIKDAVHAWHMPISQRVQCTMHFHAHQSKAYKHGALTLPQKHGFLATREASPPAMGPGPSTSHNCNKHQAIDPPQTPLSSLASSLVSTPTPTNHFHCSVWPVTTKGLIIHSPNSRDKGKGKAVSMLSTEDDSMAVDPDLVNPSKGNADKDGELVDFLESPKELAEKKNA
ncbi:hypothetical protein C0995_002037 [Termitomyces sp. Mi166|nr:hypothetical protein C0995_002037 [Termitomyces sp. Mi166\